MSEKKQIEEFRENNLGQLQKNLDTLAEIRDQEDEIKKKCPNCGEMIKMDISSAARDKNRIEAAKGIARHLGALQPERLTQAQAMAGAVSGVMNKELSKKEQADLDEFLEDYKDGEDTGLVS